MRRRGGESNCLLDSALCCPLAGVQINAAQWCFSGFMAGFSAFNAGSFPGIIFMVGGGAWAALAVFSLWVLKDVSSRRTPACASVHGCGLMWIVRRSVGGWGLLSTKYGELWGVWEPAAIGDFDARRRFDRSRQRYVLPG
jgi:hypothetical protein